MKAVAATTAVMIGTLAATLARAEDIAVFAAGSLKAPLTEIARAFERQTGAKVTLTFGASGLLRDRIGSGERADVFASANMEHPRGLVAFGWASTVERFARNSMCVLAAPNVKITTDTALATLLDPAIKVGTSTPKADPSGDYAWEVFRKADALQPGAFATLTAKARQLVGGPQSPPPPADRSAYAELVTTGAADVFVTYCTNAALASREVPGLHWVKLPKTLDVAADYGLAVRRDAPPSARAFADYVLSADGRRQLVDYGFDPP
jgi:molybdenum ABC transporter molybdate-binding protein